MITYPAIEKRTNITPEEFFANYVGKKPVILSGYIKQWPALSLWQKNYFISLAGDKKMNLNILSTAGKQEKEVFLKDYVNSVLGSKAGQITEQQSYFRDLPLPTILNELKQDMSPFPLAYFPKWYHKDWIKNVFLFYTKAGTTIATHFDKLGTHNTFFHIRGRKKFILILPQDIKYCYMQRYNSCPINPEQPDFDKYPLFKHATPYEAILEPGDMLYLPPFTLHYVHSIDACISTKIDWHTRKSTMGWLARLHPKMGLANIKYNLAFMLGVLGKIPGKYVYPFYRNYLSRLRVFLQYSPDAE